jgi:hypothetical protein
LPLQVYRFQCNLIQLQSEEAEQRLHHPVLAVVKVQIQFFQQLHQQEVVKHHLVLVEMVDQEVVVMEVQVVDLVIILQLVLPKEGMVDQELVHLITELVEVVVLVQSVVLVVPQQQQQEVLDLLLQMHL